MSPLNTGPRTGMNELKIIKKVIVLVPVLQNITVSKNQLNKEYASFYSSSYQPAVANIDTTRA